MMESAVCAPPGVDKLKLDKDESVLAEVAEANTVVLAPASWIMPLLLPSVTVPVAVAELLAASVKVVLLPEPKTAVELAVVALWKVSILISRPSEAVRVSVAVLPGVAKLATTPVEPLTVLIAVTKADKSVLVTTAETA